MKWLDKLNEMYASNPYTDNERVAVDYYPNTDVIVVKVSGEVRTIDASQFNELGMMTEINKVVVEMYYGTDTPD
jgi:hypothetical protein